MRFQRRWAFLFGMLACLAGRADESSSSALSHEIGLTLGTPAGVNVTLGQWGTESVPIVTRISGMQWDNRARGLQVDFGWAFDRDGVFKQYIGVSAIWAEASHIQGADQIKTYGFGPSYGFNAFGFWLQGGLAVGRTQLFYPDRPTRDNPVSLVAQLGYTLVI